MIHDIRRPFWLAERSHHEARIFLSLDVLGLGYYAPLVHYLTTGLNKNRWTFAAALLAVGLSIFVMGIVLHRFSPAFARRFVRRPPPGVV